MNRDLRTEPRTAPPPPVVDEKMSRTGRTLTIVGFFCAGLSLMLLPVVFGPAAIVCGLVAWRSGDRLGGWAAAAGLVCLVAGLAIASVVVNNARIE